MTAQILLLVLGMIYGPDNLTVVGYEEGQEVAVRVSTIPNRGEDAPYYLEEEAAERFREMHAAAAMDGIELRVNSGFRTHKQQQRLYRRKGPSIAATPGFSNHQLGLAVDIDNCERWIEGTAHPTIVYWWLKRNAPKFGFHQTVEHERWHWVYQKEK